MKSILHGLLAALLPAFVSGSAFAQAPTPSAGESPFEVVQIWACEMNSGTTEAQVEALARDWLKAVRQMPGGAAANVKVFFPTVVNKTDGTDFYLVLNTPTYTDWGKLWDAYTESSPAAKSDDSNQGKVECPDSMLWEAHAIEVK